MTGNICTKNVIVIPSYNETKALPQFLTELVPLLSASSVIIIADDSPEDTFIELKKAIATNVGFLHPQIIFSHQSGKGGRGAAVKRGIVLALDTFPELGHVLECDADGSHRAEDVKRILDHDSSIDLVIGSRYVAGSKISNWPKSRMLFSKVLNYMIPRLLGLEINDVTNGLRRYSRRCALEVMTPRSINSGFTYLSEQALIVTRNHHSICEVPIHFVNRILGESTVTYKEILDSITGIFKLLPQRIKNN